MADGQTDDSQKTEEPTPRRLEEARKKGQIAKSQEVSHWFMILALSLMVAFLAPGIMAGVGKALVGFLARPHAIPLDRDGLGSLMTGATLAVARELALPLLLLVAAALAAGLIQAGFHLTVEPVTPKLQKISLLGGAKRLFSLRALAEFLKGIAKLAIVATVVSAMLWPERHVIPDIVTMDVAQFMALLQVFGLKVLVAVLAVMTVIAGLDYLFQKQQHLKQLRMSKQEIKDEFKQTEGDPMIKGKLRQLRLERSRQRMMAAVPEADVVVTNPTHYAVALRYEVGSEGAPRVTAKGIDSLALRIRELAEEHAVPIVENPPLARALYAGVELDQEIPEEHYRAVAEIIGYVMRLKGKLGGAAAR